MQRAYSAISVFLGLLLVPKAVAQLPDLADIETLPDFQVERVTPPANTDSYIALTFDSLGRPVVSKEHDHPRTLFDNDGDGVFETERVFSDRVKDCQGLWFDGRTLYGSCAPDDGQPRGRRASIFKLKDGDGDDVAEVVDEVSPIIGGIQEHGPHAIRRGPDGQPWVIIGNNAFVPDETINPSSPLRNERENVLPAETYDDPRFRNSEKKGFHGTLVRIDPGEQTYSLVFGGLRNAYDFAFNLDGEAFTFDSDMEWDIGLPWYRPIRDLHMIPGGNGGYRDGSGKQPPWYIDSLPPMRELGRGSPVGVEFYQSRAYPPAYMDALLEADWITGQIHLTPLERSGATYKPAAEAVDLVNIDAIGLTDVEVGPDGMVYFTIGGRNRPGGLYRVRYIGPLPLAPEPGGVYRIVRQPQPLSSWGWKTVEEILAAPEVDWRAALGALAADTTEASRDRRQALYTMVRHGPAPSADLLETLAGDDDPDVRAAAVFAAGLQSTDAAKAITAGALRDDDAFVQRRAAEALVRQGLEPDNADFVSVTDILGLLASPDRFTRYAGRLALDRSPDDMWPYLRIPIYNTVPTIEQFAAILRSGGDTESILDEQFAMLDDPQLDADSLLYLLRTFELSALASPEGLSADRREQLHNALIGRFPSDDDRVNRELAILLAYAGQPQAITALLDVMPEGEEKPELQIFYVYNLRTIRQGWTSRDTQRLIEWFDKAAHWRGGNSFSGYLESIFSSAVLGIFTYSERAVALERVPELAGDLNVDDAVVASAASQRYPGSVAPSSLVTVFHLNLPVPPATVTDPADIRSILSNVRVRITDYATGTQRYAGLLHVDPQQVNFELNTDAVNGFTLVDVLYNEQPVARGSTIVVDVAPGLFTANANGRGPASAVLVRNTPSGDRTSLPTALFDEDSGRWVNEPLELNVGASYTLLLFGTGFRAAGTSGVSVTIGGTPVATNFAGAYAYAAGVDFVEVPISTAFAGSGEQHILLTADGFESNTVTIEFR